MLEDLLQREYWGNPVQSYLYFAAVIVGAMVALRVFRMVVLRRLAKLAATTESRLDDFIVSRLQKDVNPIVYTAVAYFSLSLLHVTPKAETWLNHALLVTATFFGVRLLAALASFALESRWSRAEQSEQRLKNMRGFLTLVRFIVWALGAVFLLDNLGFEISAIVTGLGIGGIAVALAAQAVLGDLFSSLAILLDRPFEVGDFIIVGDFMGTVEYIGLKTTRLRSLGGEQIIIANSDLTNSRVRNFKRMAQRRVVFKLGVTYDTPLERLREIPEIVKLAVEAQADTLFDRAHFFSFGASSLDFECVYLVLSADYNRYMDIQQNINLALKEEFDRRAISFAFPTQTLLMHSAPKPS